MTTKIPVVGVGYTGTAAIKQLEDELVDIDTELIWISNIRHHLVRHEIHQDIIGPTIQERLILPVEEIRSFDTRFVCGEVVAFDIDERKIILADGSAIGFDYVLVSLGSQTARYDIDGFETHVLILENLDDVLVIHRAVIEVAHDVSDTDSARIAVCGGGFTGSQCTGKITALCRARAIPTKVTIVEANENIAPNHNDDMRTIIREWLLARNVELATDNPVESVYAARIHFNDRDSMDYDTLVWTGGVTSLDTLSDTDINREQGRLAAETTFEAGHERVFAVGDCALID